jgi:uncharacterized protein with HEPN domain
MSFDDYLNNKLVQHAVISNFEVLGEAAKMISDETKLLHPEIEWRKMGDFRNVLILDYFGINQE